MDGGSSWLLILLLFFLFFCLWWEFQGQLAPQTQICQEQNVQMLRSVGQPRWHCKQPWLMASTACTQQEGGFRKKHFITARSRFIFSLSCIIKCELFVFLWENPDSAQPQHFIWRIRKGFIQNPKAISEYITALNERLEQKQGKKIALFLILLQIYCVNTDKSFTVALAVSYRGSLFPPRYVSFCQLLVWTKYQPVRPKLAISSSSSLMQT